MVRVFLFTLLIFFFSPLVALEISISHGMDKNQTYAVIDLYHKEPFTCIDKKDPYGNIASIICQFKKKPAKEIQPVENDFFILNTRLDQNYFFLIIKAKFKIYYKPIIFNLAEEKRIFSPKTATAKRWVIVGYKEKLPFIKPNEPSEMKINFPFIMQYDALPYVGGLDLKGQPVHIKNSEDIKAYVAVKQMFKDKDYENCIEKADEVLLNYPKSLFRSELEFYKIKSYFKLKSYEEVIKLSKDFLHEYSSDENVPEVLLLTAVSYYKSGIYSDADYFFDRLFSEHHESKFTQWGYVYKGDMAVDSGEDKKAKKYYLRALHETKDLEVAANAAFKLAQIYIRDGKYKQAKKYLDKILRAKDDFFYKHYAMAKEMMLDLADSKHYLEAAKIDAAIMKYMNRREDDYEANLRSLGVWYAKAGKKQEALQALERYIKEFKDGNFIEEVEKTRDALFFETNEGKSQSDLLKKYDQLIQTYGNDPIGQKALYEKIKLMLQKKMFSDVLQLKNEIEALDSEKFQDKDTLIQKAAEGLIENALNNKQCQVVLDVQNDYNVTVEKSFDDGLYECFIKAADYIAAKKIAQENLQTDNLDKKALWLYRYIKVLFATGNYTEVIQASKDLLALVDDIKNTPYKDIYRTLFDAYDRVGDFDGMVDTIQHIEAIFGLSYKDIDRYVDMINVGVSKKDDTIVIKYGKKLYDLQQRLNSHAQSPFVEFALYQAYMNKREYEKALAVISSLDSVTLSPKERSRQKYLKGMVLEKLWRDAEAARSYKASIEADKTSPWAKLAQSALEILQER
jgi:tetratricopeptide (TPR) repeat protein